MKAVQRQSETSRQLEQKAAEKTCKEDLNLEPDYEYIAPSEKIKVSRYLIGEVAKFIEAKGEGFFLISYKVGNVSEAMEELKAKHIKLIDNAPRELLRTKYAFLHHPGKLNGVLTEIIEGNIDFNKP